MLKDKYISILNDTPLVFEYDDVLAYICGIYAVAVEDTDITSDDMIDITIAGDKVKASYLGEEVIV